MTMKTVVKFSTFSLLLAVQIAFAAETNSIALVTGQFIGKAAPPDELLSLWYRQPAKVWTEALAIGNGRLGAMVFGGIEHERLQLNEDTLWAGAPYDPSNTNALKFLPEARR